MRIRSRADYNFFFTFSAAFFASSSILAPAFFVSSAPLAPTFFASSAAFFASSSVFFLALFRNDVRDTSSAHSFFASTTLAIGAFFLTDSIPLTQPSFEL